MFSIPGNSNSNRTYQSLAYGDVLCDKAKHIVSGIADLEHMTNATLIKLDRIEALLRIRLAAQQNVVQPAPGIELGQALTRCRAVDSDEKTGERHRRKSA